MRRMQANELGLIPRINAHAMAGIRAFFTLTPY